ncbi:hypothetical protein D5270_15660 [Acutalibacter sp. 1XD8-36]|nr:hypothetical protein [Acutalibacter sp. 1XD8-36]
MLILALCICFLSSCAANKMYELHPIDGHYVRQGARLRWKEEFPARPLSQAFYFTSSPEAVSIELKAYRVVDGKSETLLDGGISIGQERKPVSQLTGRLYIETMDGLVHVVIDCSGLTEYTIEPGDSFVEESLDTHFLDASQSIEMNQEVPLCTFSYSTDADGGKEQTLVIAVRFVGSAF